MYGYYHYHISDVTRQFLQLYSLDLNRLPLKPVLGAWPVLHITLLVTNRLNKTGFLFSFL